MGVPEPEAEHPVHDGDVEPPSTPTAIEQRLTQRILALEAMKGQGVIYPHVTATPFNQEVGNGSIGNLSAQKAANTPVNQSITVPFGGMSPNTVPGIALGVHTGTEIDASEVLTKQIIAMNNIFEAIDLCHEQQNKLGLKESQAMFALAHDSSDEEYDSADESGQADSTPQLGTQKHGESSDDESDSDESKRGTKDKYIETSARKKLSKIQGALRSLSKYKITLERKLRDYISEEFKLKCLVKEERPQAETVVKFNLPSGIGSRPNMALAKKFKETIMQHLALYPVTLCCLIPVIYQTFGYNDGKVIDTQLTMKRWVPPNMHCKEYLQNTPYKAFMRRFVRQNTSLYTVMSNENDSALRAYFGTRSNGGHQVNRVITVGRPSDAISIITSAVYYHEAFSYVDLQILKTKIVASYGMFGTMPLGTAIKTLRVLLNKALTLRLRVPWHLITEIASVLITRHPVFASSLSSWLEPSDSIDPEDALEHALVFISHIDHIGEKLRLSIADVKQKSQMNIYQTNSENRNHFDISKLEAKQAGKPKYSKSQGERYNKPRDRQQFQSKSRQPRQYSARAARNGLTECSTAGCKKTIPEGFKARFPKITNPTCQGCFEKKNKGGGSAAGRNTGRGRGRSSFKAMHARIAVKPARAKRMSQAMVSVPEKGAKNNWLNPKWMQKQIGEAVGQAMTPQRSNKGTKSRGMQDYIRQTMGLNEEEVIQCRMTRIHYNQPRTKQQQRTRQSRCRLRGETREREMRKRALQNKRKMQRAYKVAERDDHELLAHHGGEHDQGHGNTMDITTKLTGGRHTTTPTECRAQPEPAPTERYEGHSPTPKSIKSETKAARQDTPKHYHNKHTQGVPNEMQDKISSSHQGSIRGPHTNRPGSNGSQPTDGRMGVASEDTKRELTHGDTYGTAACAPQSSMGLINPENTEHGASTQPEAATLARAESAPEGQTINQDKRGADFHYKLKGSKPPAEVHYLAAMTRMGENTQGRDKDGMNEYNHHGQLHPTKSTSRVWEAQGLRSNQHANIHYAQRERHREREDTEFTVTQIHERIGTGDNTVHNGGATHDNQHLIAGTLQPTMDSRRERDLAHTMSNRDQMRSHTTTMETKDGQNTNTNTDGGGDSQPEPGRLITELIGGEYNETKQPIGAHFRGVAKPNSNDARHTHTTRVKGLTPVPAAPGVKACLESTQQGLTGHENGNKRPTMPLSGAIIIVPEGESDAHRVARIVEDALEANERSYVAAQHVNTACGALPGEKEGNIVIKTRDNTPDLACHEKLDSPDRAAKTHQGHGLKFAGEGVNAHATPGRKHAANNNKNEPADARTNTRIPQGISGRMPRNPAVTPEARAQHGSASDTRSANNGRQSAETHPHASGKLQVEVRVDVRQQHPAAQAVHRQKSVQSDNYSSKATIECPGPHAFRSNRKKPDQQHNALDKWQRMAHTRATQQQPSKGGKRRQHKLARAKRAYVCPKTQIRARARSKGRCAEQAAGSDSAGKRGTHAPSFRADNQRAGAHGAGREEKSKCKSHVFCCSTALADTTSSGTDVKNSLGNPKEKNSNSQDEIRNSDTGEEKLDKSQVNTTNIVVCRSVNPENGETHYAIMPREGEIVPGMVRTMTSKDMERCETVTRNLRKGRSAFTPLAIKNLTKGGHIWPKEDESASQKEASRPCPWSETASEYLSRVGVTPPSAYSHKWPTQTRKLQDNPGDTRETLRMNQAQRDDPLNMETLGLSPIKDGARAVIKDVMRSEHRQDKDWMKKAPMHDKHSHAYGVTFEDDKTSQYDPPQEDIIMVRGLHLEENMTANPARVDRRDKARHMNAPHRGWINRGQKEIKGEEIGLSPNHPLVDFVLQNEYQGDYAAGRKEFKILSIMVDTGCASTIIKSENQDFVMDSYPSPAVISGFQGTEKVRGGVRGTVHLYALDEKGLGANEGGYLRHQVDTLETLNMNLLSLSNLYARENYDMVIPAKSTGLSSGFTKEGPNGKMNHLPMAWDAKAGAFKIHFLMASNKADAISWGRKAESYMKSKHTSRCNMSQADKPRRTNSGPSRNTSGIHVRMTAYKTPSFARESGGRSHLGVHVHKPIMHHRTKCSHVGSMPGRQRACGCKFNTQFLQRPHGESEPWEDQCYEIREDSTRKDALRQSSNEFLNELESRGKQTDVRDGICAYVKNGVRITISDDFTARPTFLSDYSSGSSDTAEDIASPAGDMDASWTMEPEPTGVHDSDDIEDDIDVSHDTEGVDIDTFREQDYEANDANLKGTKAGMKSKKLRNMTEFQLHKRRGHLGFYPNCLICRMIRGSHRKIATKHSPFIETRTGYSWVGDTITWSHPSRYGNKYTIVLRDIASGYFACLHLKTRKTSSEALREWIETMRKNPLFSKLGYPIVQALRLDPAGEWSYKNVEFMNMIKHVGVTVMWSSPDDKRSAAHAENSCKQIEVVAKSILLEQNLPYTFIEDAVNQGAMLRNLFPLTRNISSSDGDAIRPLEEITGGQISRRQCDNRLHHMITLGSPCIVHSPKVKGSRIDRTKSRWGIALTILGDVPIFLDPYDKSLSRTFTSKNYHEVSMPDGFNFYTLLGLQEPDLIKDAEGNPIFPRPHRRDSELRTVVKIGDYLGRGVQRPKAGVQEILDRDETKSEYHDPKVILINNNGDIYEQYDGGLKPSGTNIRDKKASTGKLDQQNADEKRRQVEDISHNPRGLIDTYVFKFFEGFGLCRGKISSYNKRFHYWRIVWEMDNTWEEWDRQDMIEMLVEERDVHKHAIGSHEDPINLPDVLLPGDEINSEIPPEPEMGNTERTLEQCDDDIPDGYDATNNTKLPRWDKIKNKRVSWMLNQLNRIGVRVPTEYTRANGKLKALWKVWSPDTKWEPTASTNGPPKHLLPLSDENQHQNLIKKKGTCVPANQLVLDEDRDKGMSLTSTSDEEIGGEAESDIEELPSSSARATVTYKNTHAELPVKNPPAHPIIDLTTEPEPEIGSQMRQALQDPYISPSESDESDTPNKDGSKVISKKGYTLDELFFGPSDDESDSDPYAYMKESPEEAVFRKAAERREEIREDRKQHQLMLQAQQATESRKRPEIIKPITQAKTTRKGTSLNQAMENEHLTPDEGCRVMNIDTPTKAAYATRPNTPITEESKPKCYKMPEYLKDVDAVAFYTTPKHIKYHTTFPHVCEEMGLAGKEKAYYYWLGETYGEFGINKGPWDTNGEKLQDVFYGVHFSNPWGVSKTHRGTKTRQILIRPGSAFPRPFGPEYERLIKIHKERQNLDDERKESAKALKETMQGIQAMQAYYTKVGRQVCEVPAAIDARQRVMLRDNTHELDYANVYATTSTPQRTRQDIITQFFESDDKPETTNGGIIHPLTGKIIPPKDFQEIFTREDRIKWMKATLLELDAFDKREAILHDLTLKEIRAMGITHSPVPMRILYDVKYLPDGSLQKFKARQIVQGHKQYMRFGEHFHTTFAPAPTLATNRLLQAIITHKRWHRVVFDICTAYLWAPAPKHERIPLRYPVGLRRYDSKTGEELMGVLLKMIYGCPQSAFRWAEFRQKWMERHFKNELKWGYHQAKQDPCLTMLTNPKTGVISYVVSHVDDIELAGANLSDLKFIEDRYRKEFEIKSGDPRFMLGIQREMKKDNNGIGSIYLSQPDFLEETYKLYQGKMKKTVPNSPMPVGEFLHLGQDASTDAEHKHYLALGYQNIAGACLWGARNCFPECMYGTAQICRLMSKPNKRAWDCACRILQYMYHKRKEGIRFREDGAPFLQCYYDSSHKADPTDGKAQYGWVITLMNGPVEWNSKKHNHVGISSSHNEYMALSHATKAVMWLRQLLFEMRLTEYTPGPTPMMGDNDQATLLSQQDMVTNGNKFYLLDYHYSREAIKDGHTDTRRVDTKENYSDMFTKSVPGTDMERLGEMLKGNKGLHQEPTPSKAE